MEVDVTPRTQVTIDQANPGKIVTTSRIWTTSVVKQVIAGCKEQGYNVSKNELGYVVTLESLVEGIPAQEVFRAMKIKTNRYLVRFRTDLFCAE